MNVCRTCLTVAVAKDISLLPDELEGEHKTSSDIMLYCLGIQVVPESKLTTKLCIECFLNILSFHKFKTQAIKSDEYLQSLQEQVKNEVSIDDDIKKEDEIDIFDDDDIQADIDIKYELTKVEDTNSEYQSDDELLSVIKKIKCENLNGKSKENEQKPVTKRKKPRKKRNRESERQEQMCEECGKTVRNLKDHMYIHKPVFMRKRFKCKSCEKMFSTFSARLKHYKIKHLGIKQHCVECNKDVVSLTSHCMVIHNSKPLPFECVPCGRRFLSKSKRDQHTLIHTKDRPFKCDQCDKDFRSNIMLRQHKRQVHDKEKSHLCQFCSKSFFKKYHLQVHLRSHSKEKPYECPDCGKFFTTTTTLKNHRLTHSDVKMFACQQCERIFRTPGYLRNHMVCHSREKRHSCQYCGVLFGRSDHRRRHERTAHERHLTTAPAPAPALPPPYTD